MPRGQNETQSWAVTVERNGESVVTLSSNMHAGRDLSDEDERVIRVAADHLLAFIGVHPVLVHHRLPHTFQSGCGISARGGIHWTTDMRDVSCPECLAVSAARSA